MTAFVAPVPMRWTDQDPYRHLNHARAVTLLEEARITLFFGRAAADGVPTLAAGLFVTGLDVAYRRQVTYRPAPFDVAMTVDAVRAATFRIAYALHDGPLDEPAALTAHTAMATVDVGTGRPRRLTAEEKAWLGRWTA